MWAAKLAAGLILNLVSAQWADRRAAKELSMHTATTPLPDILHSILPVIPFSSPDIFLLSLLAILIANGNYYDDAHMWALQVSVVLRAAVIHITLMPTCVPHPKSPPNGLYSKFFHCSHDLMFSGHTLCFLYVGACMHNSLVSVIGPLMLIAARQHYTIDVCVAFVVYQYVYLLYNN
tara:strand:+ start:103 stop:633 length:531 start_codon:yes stop_codon:yes gene_type:complete